MSRKNEVKAKWTRRRRRKLHVRRKVYGAAETPRLTVSRSHRHLSCQVIDDLRGVTLAAASTRQKSLQAELGGFGGNTKAASLVGKLISERVKALGIERVRFDRNGYRFHGRIKALVEAAREGGLKL